MACLLSLLIGISAAPGCKLEVEQADVQAPVRPAGVPKNAVWAGGADGGVFLIVRPVGSSEPDAYSVEVYYDHSGSRLHRGVLYLHPVKSGAFPVGEAASYSGWDGETVHLNDGRRLVGASQR
jgi:hypothetical protein